MSWGVTVGALATFALVSPSHAYASATLKKVQVTDGSRVDLFFDAKVRMDQIRTEFFNDIIQLSITEASVYPAKISSISGTDLSKVFAYQYAPKLVRCRLTVKGKSESFQERVQVSADGKVVSVRIQGMSQDEIRTSASQSNRVVPGSAGDGSPAAKSIGSQTNKAASGSETELKISDEERVLLEKVMKTPAQAPVQAVASSKEKEQEKSKKEDSSARQQSTSNLTDGKPLPSPLRSFGTLFGVLALFGVTVFAIKRFKGGQGLDNHKGMSGLLGKMASLKLGTKGKMIEVVANHYLGPKKSIAMVKIGGRILVLGISSENINLITELPGDAKTDSLDGIELDGLFSDSLMSAPALGAASRMNGGVGAVSAGTSRQNSQYSQSSGGFSDVLNQERGKPSVRAQIKSRIEGMKQL